MRWHTHQLGLQWQQGTSYQQKLPGSLQICDVEPITFPFVDGLFHWKSRLVPPKRAPAARNLKTPSCFTYRISVAPDFMKVSLEVIRRMKNNTIWTRPCVAWKGLMHFNSELLFTSTRHYHCCFVYSQYSFIFSCISLKCIFLLFSPRGYIFFYLMNTIQHFFQRSQYFLWRHVYFAVFKGSFAD